MSKIIGGPFDGGDASKFADKPELHWDNVICLYIKNTERLAIYHRQQNGDYLFEKTVHQDDLTKVE